MAPQPARIRLTRTPWFGPKGRRGWGWRPITWQGWIVTAFFGAAIVTTDIGLGRPAIPWAIALFVCFIIVVALTSAQPGGPRAQG